MTKLLKVVIKWVYCYMIYRFWIQFLTQHQSINQSINRILFYSRYYRNHNDVSPFASFGVDPVSNPGNCNRTTCTLQYRLDPWAGGGAAQFYSTPGWRGHRQLKDAVWDPGACSQEDYGSCVCKYKAMLPCLDLF